MKRKRIINKITALILATSMIIPVWEVGIKTESVSAEVKKEYIVIAKNKDFHNKISQNYKIDTSSYTEHMDNMNISISEMTKTQVEELEQENNVVSIEENFRIEGCGENSINPKDISNDWNLRMINADKSKYSNKTKKKVKKYEKKAKESKDKVKIAIIDSGVDETGDINVKERCNLVPEDQGISVCFEDNTGHGTAIAGIISSVKDSNTEVSGLNTNVELYSIKVMDMDNTAPLSRIIEGIYRAIEYDVDIINMSFGTTKNSIALYKAIRAAYEKGIFLVAAAGNRGYEDEVVEYPAAYNEVIAVGAVGTDANMTEESSKGDKIDVVAPGELVRTLTSFGLETASTGTSIAAPHVSAMAAILWERDRSKSANFIRGLIECSTNKIEEKGVSYGMIDIGYAQEIYEEYEENYDEGVYQVKENTNEIVVDNETIEVAAKWAKSDHEVLVTNANGGKLTAKQLKLVKAGTRYNDDYMHLENESYPQRRIWHALGSATNYMSAVYYIGKVIQEEDVKQGNVPKTPGLTDAQYNQMKEDIKKMKTDAQWQVAMNKYNLDIDEFPNTKANQRLLLFGISLHTITDAFAHRAWIKTNGGDRWNGWVFVGGDYSDSTTAIASRYKAAGQVVKNAFNQCLNATTIKNSYTIRSKQIMYQNSYFDGTFALKQLMFMAKVNKENDNTYNSWYKQMGLYTYTDVATEQAELDAIDY